MYFSLNLIDKLDRAVNFIPLPKQSNNTISLFYIFANSDAHLHTRACLLNFSGTAQNWMAIVVPPHYPLPCGSSFIELDYREETDHSEDLSNFIGASPKLDAKWMMHHHDDLSMLMVAPHGCVD